MHFCVTQTTKQQKCNKTNKKTWARKINCMVIKDKGENNRRFRNSANYIFVTQRFGKTHYGSTAQQALLLE